MVALLFLWEIQENSTKETKASIVCKALLPHRLQESRGRSRDISVEEQSAKTLSNIAMKDTLAAEQNSCYQSGAERKCRWNQGGSLRWQRSGNKGLSRARPRLLGSNDAQVCRGGGNVPMLCRLIMKDTQPSRKG
jgi:hypothetical protein